MVQLNAFGKTVKIDAGELIGYEVNSHEYIHQKGSPGWRNSDTEMFPIIGPTVEANYKVETPRGMAVQDQHGLLREMEYDLISHTDSEAFYQKKYEAGSLIRNSKYPEKSSEEQLSWPYSFEFQKHFKITEAGLEIEFHISGEEGMPFMLGYHPAFKLYSQNAKLKTAQKSIALDEILKAGSRAFLVPNCQYITLQDAKELRIETEGFGHFMLWTEKRNMLCIEPITFYPYAVAQKDLRKGFQQLSTTARKFKFMITTND